VQENQSQIEAIFAAHNIQKSEYGLYTGFDESVIRAEIGFLEQIHIFSSSSVIPMDPTSLLSQLGKIFTPFSSLLFTESSIYELPIYKPDGTTWDFDKLVFQTAFKHIDKGSTATAIPTVISTCTASCPGLAQVLAILLVASLQRNQENKKGKGKAEDDEMEDRDNEDNKDDNSRDPDNPDDKKPENPFGLPTVFFDVMSEMTVNQNGLEKLFQELGVKGQIMIHVCNQFQPFTCIDKTLFRQNTTLHI
jgi:hypothetical protein